jgi:antitoxin CptB
VDLLEWFTRRSQPEDPELRAFVAELLDRVAQKG